MGNKKLLDDLPDQILLKFKTSETINDMAKVSIKFEKSTLYGRIIHEGEQFSRHVGPVIDKVQRGALQEAFECVANHDGNANVRSRQHGTLERIYSDLESDGNLG